MFAIAQTASRATLTALHDADWPAPAGTRRPPAPHGPEPITKAAVKDYLVL